MAEMRGRGRGRLVRAVLMLVALAAVVVVAAMTLGGSAHHTAAPAANLRAARADAAALLASMRLPRGAQRSAREPAGDSGVLSAAAENPFGGVVVDAGAWWTVRASPAAVLAFVERFRGPGATLLSTGSGSGGDPHAAVRGYLSADLQWPAVTNVLEVRDLDVEATVLADGRTGVRADAQVVPITPRGQIERLPVDATRVEVSATADRAGGQRTQTARVVTSPAAIARVVTLLNSLPLEPSDSPFECGPEIDRASVRLTFRSGSAAPPLATAVLTYPLPVAASWGWCDLVTLTIAGHRQRVPLIAKWWSYAGLSPFPPLLPRLGAALGVALPAGGP